MNDPDFDFWRQERARVLSDSFNEFRETITVGSYLTAIDTILEIEPLLRSLRDNLKKAVPA